jgi:glycosyltransferase involved in cell wall biosynthesis
LKICVVGKFPPIEGGVSMRTYWTAHALAARGHEVHVVTNAKEGRAPFRMHMRAEDWKRCEAVYGAGSVTVHWTDPADSSQFHIPAAGAFVSKLASVAAHAHSEHRFDVIYSHYIEPYGVAAHLAAEMTGLPHVVRMAGSDSGRLWRHPQFEALYDHVLRSAEVVITRGAAADRAIQRGVARDRIAVGGHFTVPEDLFTPEGPKLDLDGLRSEVAQNSELRDLLWGEFAADRPYFGIYGKLGREKGSFALLAAMSRLKRAGLKTGLVAVAHHEAEIETEFRATARQLGVVDCILQVPFLPHWRVPEFLRSCMAVCCLEQGFGIAHSPIIPIEVLLCGTCLVGSAEVLHTLRRHQRPLDECGCIDIADVSNVEVLSERLAALVENPRLAATVAAKGCSFARELQRDIPFPQSLECILEAAAGRRRVPSSMLWSADEPAANSGSSHLPFAQLASEAVAATRPPIGQIMKHVRTRTSARHL